MQIDLETVVLLCRKAGGEDAYAEHSNYELSALVELLFKPEQAMAFAQLIAQRAASQEREAVLEELDRWSNLKAGKVAMLIRAQPSASSDCQRPECMSHGCFSHCLRGNT